MKVRAFITHKKAESYSDCADYYSINPRTGRMAVCDGISQSFRPLEWARILAKEYTDAEFNPSDPESVKPLQKKWQASLLPYLAELQAAGKITYGVENNINERKSAGSTFCGVQFDGNDWSAKILGDSAVISFKEGKLEIYSSQEGAFNNRPDHFDSYEKPSGNVKEISGTMEKGHVLLMVSDPFSELFQKLESEGGAAGLMKKILSVNTQLEYLILVDYLRREYKMHNDDSTLLIIECDGSDEMSILTSETLDAHIQAESSGIEKALMAVVESEPKEEPAPKTAEEKEAAYETTTEAKEEPAEEEKTPTPQTEQNVMSSILGRLWKKN